MMEKISGIVENINTQKRDGIKVANNWYNATDISLPMVSKVDKGDNVEMQVEGKAIQDIKILPKPATAPTQKKQFGGKPFATKEQVIKAMDDLLKHSIELVKGLEGWDEDAKKSFGITHFIATKEAMQKRGLL